MRIKSIFDGYSKSVSKVLMLPSGREFLTLSGVDDEIHQWRIVNSRIEPGWSVEGGSVVEERFLDLAVHPSGEYFACAARHRKVELRDSTNGQLIKEFGKASKSDQLSGYASCRFSINGSILVASQIRSTKTEFYSTTDGRRIGTIWDEVVTTFAAHPEGELIAALLNGGRRAAIQFLRITHSREMSQIGVRYLLRFLARDLRFSPAGDYLESVP